MPKPLLTIKDFSQGIVYDESDSTLTGFYDVVNIDLKNIDWAALLGENFVQTSWSGAFLWSNNPLTWNVDIKTPVEWWEANVFVPRSPSASSSAQIMRYNWQAKTWSTFMNTLSGYPPIFHEICTFNNSLVFSNGASFIGSCFWWTSGSNANIAVTNGSPTVTIALGYGMQTFSRRMVWWTFSIWNSTTSAYVNYTVSAYVSTTEITLSANYTGTTTTTTKGFCYNFTNAWFLRESWATTTCSLPNTTPLYRPLIEKDGQLYVWDGDRVCSLDSTLSVWSTVNGSGAISVGTDYMVKQMQKIGWYIYILADKMPQAYYNSQTLGQVQRQEESRLFVWDGASQGFSNIIDIWTHCYCIKTIENRIYAVLRSTKWDGALFTYFNGSDFPTIGKIQLSNISCPISNIAYDRWKFMIVANGTDREWQTVNAIFTFGAYATERACFYKPYSNALGSIYGIWFVKDWSDWFDPSSVNSWIGQILMLSQDLSSWDKVLKRVTQGFQASWYITTQRYEVSWNQFTQLVKWVQLDFKETLPSWATVDIYYKWDEETSFTLLGAVTSSNQGNLIYGINKRYREIQLKTVLKSAWQNVTPKLFRISLY